MALRPARALRKLSAQRTYKELFILALGIVSVVSIGTVGYHLIEDWGLFDSLYMTVTTLATVGYQEVHPLSSTGRAFTLLLIVLGVGIVTVSFATISQVIVEHEFTFLFGRNKMNTAIAKLSDHIIVCGYGRLARIAVSDLNSAGRQLVVIEQNESTAEECRELGHLVVTGDASQDEVLEQAGVKRAKYLASLLPKDSDNLYVILTSRELNPKLFILSRAEDDLGEKRLNRAGADRIISPYRIGGRKIAEGLLRPYVTDFLDLAGSNSKGNMVIEEIKIPPDSPLNGRSFREVTLRKRANVLVAAIITKDGESIVNPSGDTIIEPGSTFIALGTQDELTKLEQTLLGI